MASLTALIVDDDTDFRGSMALLVEREGFIVREADSVSHARARASPEAPADVVLVDLSLPDGDGLDLMARGRRADGADAVRRDHRQRERRLRGRLRCAKGALDYLTKPVDRARLQSVLAHVSRSAALRAEVNSLRGELRQLGRFGPLIGRSKPMQEVYDLIARVAPTDATVLVIGESGTGKELVAQTIHALSRRKADAVRRGQLRRDLAEPDRERALRPRARQLHRRRPAAARLLRAGRRRHAVPRRDHRDAGRAPGEAAARARVARGDARRLDRERARRRARRSRATNRDPKQAVEEGTLREDLFYRLNVFPIHLPPLRERGDDIALLAEHFLGALNRRESSEKRWSEPALARDSRARLAGQRPRAAQRRRARGHPRRSPDPGARTCRAAVAGAKPIAETGSDAVLHVPVGSSIAEVEQRLILSTLEQLHGDKKRAAEILGISLKTLYNRLAVYSASAQGLRPAKRGAPRPRGSAPRWFRASTVRSVGAHGPRRKRPRRSSGPGTRRTGSGRSAKRRRRCR